MRVIRAKWRSCTSFVRYRFRLRCNIRAAEYIVIVHPCTIENSRPWPSVSTPDQVPFPLRHALAPSPSPLWSMSLPCISHSQSSSVRMGIAADLRRCKLFRVRGLISAGFGLLNLCPSDWNFWTADDPTLGQVNYRSWQDSWNLGLIYSQPGTEKVCGYPAEGTSLC